jgi:hypothetical protein
VNNNNNEKNRPIINIRCEDLDALVLAADAAEQAGGDLSITTDRAGEALFKLTPSDQLEETTARASHTFADEDTLAGKLNFNSTALDMALAAREIVAAIDRHRLPSEACREAHDHLLDAFDMTIDIMEKVPLLTNVPNDVTD